MAEYSTFWCIAILYRDQELNSQETTKEEDPKSQDSLENREKKMYEFVCQTVELQLQA